MEIQEKIEDIEEHRRQALGAMCNGEMSREEFDKYCKDSVEAIKKCKKQLVVAEDKYKDLYNEHVVVNRAVKRFRVYLRMGNFLERFLAENKVTIIVSKEGSIGIIL